MAEMLVNSTKLDACLDAEADAIRAKTGGSTDLTFDFANNKGFADAIAAIPSGGSPTYEWKKLAEYTANESVHAIKINATAEMLEAKGLRFNCNLTLTGSDYIYFALNTPSTNNRSYTASVSSFSGYVRVDPYVKFDSSDLYHHLTLSAIGGGGHPVSVYSTFSSLDIVPYTSGKNFAIGSSVAVWGYVKS